MFSRICDVKEVAVEYFQQKKKKTQQNTRFSHTLNENFGTDTLNNVKIFHDFLNTYPKFPLQGFWNTVSTRAC